MYVLLIRESPLDCSFGELEVPLGKADGKACEWDTGPWVELLEVSGPGLGVESEAADEVFHDPSRYKLMA